MAKHPHYREHVHCSCCGTRCSGIDPELGLIVRAFVQCPECISREAHAAAVALGQRGGRAKSPAKTAANRLNGKKGGRPKKAKNA